MGFVLKPADWLNGFPASAMVCTATYGHAGGVVTDRMFMAL
jgi:hypothetical protein